MRLFVIEKATYMRFNPQSRDVLIQLWRGLHTVHTAAKKRLHDELIKCIGTLFIVL